MKKAARGRRRLSGRVEAFRESLRVRSKAGAAIQSCRRLIRTQHSDAELGGAGRAGVALGLPQEGGAETTPPKALAHDEIGDDCVFTGRVVQRFEGYAREDRREPGDCAATLGDENRPSVLAASVEDLRQVAGGHGLTRPEPVVDSPLELLELDDAATDRGSVVLTILANHVASR